MARAASAVLERGYHFPERGRALKNTRMEKT